MSRSALPPRRPGPLPVIPSAETDEVLSSWLSRVAARYRVRSEVLLEQVVVTEISSAILDRHTTPADLETIATVLRSSPRAIQRMSFAGQPREALELVAHKHPLWSCPECEREFAGRDPVRIKLRQWFVAVSSSCR